MKKRTIRKQLALWYALSVVIVLALFFLAAVLIFRPTLVRNVEQLLEQQAAMIADAIELDDGQLEIEYEDILLQRGSEYAIYTLEGAFAGGNQSLKGLGAMRVSSGTRRAVDQTGEQWLIADRLVIDDDESIALLRVAMTTADVAMTTRQLSIIFLALLPVGCGLAVAIGLFIARRALRPIDEITAAARRISRGDLSTRLHFPDTLDEVGRLASTFDEMLDSLDRAFQREKQFTSDASHELRTPLSVILTHSEEGASSPDATKEDLRASMQVIHRTSRHMQSMLNQLLALSRMFEGQQQLEWTRIDLDLLLEDVAAEHRARAAERGISLHLETQPLQIEGDLLLLTRLVTNLLDNAIRYGRPGGNVWITLERDEMGRALLAVADDGIGIPEEDLPHIFARFYRADKARSGGSGSGLGLSMVEQIAAMHRGAVQAQSAPEKGTRFAVTLPVTQD